MIESPTQVRRMPVWLSVVLIALALAGGVFAVYWFFQGSTAAQDIVLDRDPNDSVKQGGINQDTWNVRAGDFSLMVVGRERPIFKGGFLKIEGLSKQQTDLLGMTKRIAGDRAVRQVLNLTKEQRDKLNAIRAGANIDFSEADKAVLAKTFKTYLNESDTNDPPAKVRADNHFIDAVADVSRPLALTAQKSALERAEQARTLLTPEQMATYQKMGQ